MQVMTMAPPPPLLHTVDDRLARIEDLLVKVAMRLDRMEQILSRISLVKNRVHPKEA
jgi:hypothetical protein